MSIPTSGHLVTDTDVRAAILRIVRRAGQPVMEAALHARVVGLVDADVPPERFLALTEKLVTDGYLRVDVDREVTRRGLPGPFEPRYYRARG